MARDDSTVDVVERIERGECSAEEELVRQFLLSVFAMALARTGDPEVARDLAQEVMISVLCALREGSLRNPQGLAAYICTTARNRISITSARRISKRKRGLPDDLAVDRPDPEEAFSSAERSQLALQAIQSLNQRSTRRFCRRASSTVTDRARSANDWA